MRMTTPSNRHVPTRNEKKPALQQPAPMPVLPALAGKLDRLVFAAPPPRTFGLD